MGRAKGYANTYLDGGSRAPDSRGRSFREQRERTCHRRGPEDFGSAEGATSDGAGNRRRHDGAQVVRANHTDKKNSAEKSSCQVSCRSEEAGKMNRNLGLTYIVRVRVILAS